MSKKTSIFILALVAAALAVAAAFAASYPQFTANSPATGAIPVWDSAVGDHRLAILEVTATTDDAVFSAWAYSGGAWAKIAPVWGPAAGDTILTVPAGSTVGFVFPMRIDLIYLTSGTGTYWRGE